MTKFLQISPIDDNNCCNFKCLACKRIFSQFFGIEWRFCPCCGEKIIVINQEIKPKDPRFIDNFGYTKKVDGKWVKVKSPAFKLICESKFLDSWEVDYPVIDSHPILVRKVEIGKKHKKFFRYKIEPSKVLNLP